MTHNGRNGDEVQAGRYCDGNGLYLFVRAETARFWLFRYTVGGRMREMGLGRAGDDDAVTLDEAREEAVKNAEEVIKLWIETARSLGRKVPKPRGRLAYA